MTQPPPRHIQQQVSGLAQDQIQDLVQGRYRLLRQIGAGKMSTVYAAQDTTRGDLPVALKLLDAPQPDALRREVFRREVAALERLEHPAIVRLLDAGRDEARGCAYIALEYIPNDLLHYLEQRRRSADRNWIWPFVRQITEALIAAHAAGVIHRDLKPTNILVTPEGTPKLTDFGISYLKQELATGQTVSAFWTPGYAAPEQRGGARGDERSDLYALGCVIVHLLSGAALPSEGPTAAQLGQLPVTGQLRRVLAKLLAHDPADRYASAREVLRALATTRRYDLLPEVYMTLTANARRDLALKGVISRGGEQEAVATLLAELGEDDPTEVRLLLDRDRGDVLLLIESMRLICARTPGTASLVVKAIHVPYHLQLENQRQQGLPKRCLWQVVSGPLPAAAVQPELIATLDALLAELNTHAQSAAQARAIRTERQDLMRPWSEALQLQRELLEQARQIAFSAVTRDNGQLIFTLSEPPDRLDWPDGAPVAILEKTRKSLFLGHLLAIDGLTLTVSDEVDAEGGLPPSAQTRFPVAGSLGLYQAEARVALARLEKALATLQSGQTRNPSLPDVLQDLTQARFRPLEPDLPWFQTELGDDQRAAVRQALATDDLFVLQGPPGTGKTVTIAEIILQILRLQPDARILLSSQSNVAVNHALARVAALRAASGGAPLEILRLGRSDKIDQGAEAWMVTQRLAAWRAEVQRRMDGVIARLKVRARALQQVRNLAASTSTGTSTGAATTATPELARDLADCQSLLEHLAQEVARAEPQREAHAEVQHEAEHGRDRDHQPDALLHDPQHNTQDHTMGEALDHTLGGAPSGWETTASRETLELVRATLPAEAQALLPPAATGHDEYEQLHALLVLS